MTHNEFNDWTLKGNTLLYLTETSKETPEDPNSEVNPRPMSKVNHDPLLGTPYTHLVKINKFKGNRYEIAPKLRDRDLMNKDR
jgi:hypothetical protein